MKIQFNEVCKIENNSKPFAIKNKTFGDKQVFCEKLFDYPRSYVNFTGNRTKREKLQHNIAKIDFDAPINAKDAEKICSLFGATMVPPEIINGSHRHPWSGHKYNHREALKHTLSAVLGATLYSARDKDFGSYVIPVNNAEIGKQLKEEYDVESFNRLFNLSTENGVFDLKFNEFGFPVTTNISYDEEATMSSNVWVTDSLRILDLINDRYPERIKTIVDKLSEFYLNESGEFQKICQTPELYGTKISQDSQNFNGVGHSFNPGTLKADRKFLAVRIDSQGLFLDKISSYLLKSPDKDEKLLHPLVMIPMYLNAIGFPACKTCGNWENSLFENITSDTEIVRAGLQNLKTLLNSDGSIKEKAEELYSQKVKDWNLREYPCDFESLINSMIAKADIRLKENYVSECIDENGKKSIDAALAFVPTTATLGEDVISDVEKNLEILEALRPLVGKNGIVRYEKDAYLNLNYELAIDSDEKFDFEHLQDRWHRVGETPSALSHKAEWFMVSDISCGYGAQLNKLLSFIESEDRKPTEKEKKLIKTCYDGQVEYINRAYARITGNGAVKANGRSTQAWQVPEAYMAVTSFKENGEKVYLPGTNTPLSWAKASLYDASILLRLNLKKIKDADYNRLLIN